MADALVTIRRYLWPHEAQIARSLLESEGIDAVVQDAHLAQIDWLYIQAIGGLRLQVAAADAAQAAAVLAAVEAAPPAPAEEYDEGTCGSCGSRATERVVAGRTPTFLSWMVFGFPLWRPRTVWRCAACKAPAPSPR